MPQYRRLAAAVAAVALSLCPSLCAQTNAYIIDEISGAERLFSADISTGNSTFIANVSEPTNPRDIAWGGTPSALWAISAEHAIGTISTVTGAFSARRTLPFTGLVLNFAWSQARLEFWIVHWDTNSGVISVYAYTPASNAVRAIGPFPSRASHDLAFDAAGNLWSLESGGLYVIDQQTLVPRFVSMIDRPIERFCIDTSNGAYLALESPSQSYLELDPATGRTRLYAPVRRGQVQAWTVVPGVCLGRFLPTGTSCPGTGGIDPILDGYGCYGSGGTVHVSLRQAMSGATGILLFGLGPASIPLGNGCSLNIGPVFTDPIIALPLFGTGGAGQGFTTVSFTVPQNTVVSSLALQALVFDVGAPGAFSATNGLRLIVE